MIEIKESKTRKAEDVTYKTLFDSTVSHKNDVLNCMKFFSDNILESGKSHDNHKIETMESFHKAFVGGFKDTTWWNEHKKERHHLPLNNNTLNLVDVIEYICDCCSAGMARSGHITEVKIDEKLLMKTFKNTVEMLKNNMKLVQE